jgi:hypothetical protein
MISEKRSMMRWFSMHRDWVAAPIPFVALMVVILLFWALRSSQVSYAQRDAWADYIFEAGMGLFLGLLAADRLYRRHWTRRIRAAAGRCCVRCGYTLPPSPQDAGVCPECGRPWQIEETLAYWERWLRIDLH